MAPQSPPARGMGALCRRLPKVELHAHLHGSARLCTIADLAPPGVDQALLTSDTERSLEGCFAIFGAIHRTVTTLAAVRRITAEVLSDFAAENVKYLELRTTPRALAGIASPTAPVARRPLPVARRPCRGPPPRRRAQIPTMRANPALGLTLALPLNRRRHRGLRPSSVGCVRAVRARSTRSRHCLPARAAAAPEHRPQRRPCGSACHRRAGQPPARRGRRGAVRG